MSVWTLHYDIGADLVRRRVAAGLLALGPRVLYSAFDLPVDRRSARQALAWTAGQTAAGDRLLLVRRCPRCGLCDDGAMLSRLAAPGQVMQW
jgi:CRISPR/Cas system-associated endoribonuclease Cas2